MNLKKSCPLFCFSGKFNKRSDKAIVEHSGFICLDFDGYEKKKNLLEDKEKFQNNKFVFTLCLFSPSGNGLKVIVKIPKEIENHNKYFNSLKKESSIQNILIQLLKIYQGFVMNLMTLYFI